MTEQRLADATRAWRHVFLRDMVLHARIGVHAAEQAATQRVRINVDLAVADDAELQSRAGATDPARDELSRQVRAIVGAGHIRLVETLAERLAEACLADPRVRLARVRVEKLDVFDDTGAVGVEVERRAHFIPHQR